MRLFLTRSTVSLALTIGAFTLTLGAQTETTKEPVVSGKWTMNVTGTPHGDLTMGLNLKQTGKVVTGTFASPHGEMNVKGEFADRTLTLSTTTDDGSAITFKATLKDDDTLSGYASSSRGDMTWTATRAKEREK